MVTGGGAGLDAIWNTLYQRTIIGNLLIIAICVRNICVRNMVTTVHTFHNYTSPHPPHPHTPPPHPPHPHTLTSSQPYVLDFDQTTGHLKRINNTVSHIAANVDQTFLWWNSSDGNNINSTQPSGAYIFRPNGTAPFTVNQNNTAKIYAVQVSL